VVVVNEILYIGVLGIYLDSKHVGTAYWVVIRLKPE